MNEIKKAIQWFKYRQELITLDDKCSQMEKIALEALQEKLSREENKALTNFDRIKNMSVEEMAEFLRYTPCNACNLSESHQVCSSVPCEVAVAQWLNQPVESEVQNAK